MRIVFVILFPLFGYSQSDSILFLGNTSRLCIEVDHVLKSDTLPENYTNYSCIFIFSTAQSLLSHEQVIGLTSFVHNGGNLYLGGDNWPLQSELNTMTQFLYNKSCYGNYDHAIAESSGDGRLKLETISKIPAGTSTTSFPLDPNLSVEAWIADQPLILTALIGNGKLVIDGGYSRFYCDFNSAESREIMHKIVLFFED